MNEISIFWNKREVYLGAGRARSVVAMSGALGLRDSGRALPLLLMNDSMFALENR